MDVLAITQARSGSTRLPNKVLKTIGGVSLLEIHARRVLRSKRIGQLMIATTTSPKDEAIAQIAEKLNVPHYRGSEQDVLDRFYQAAKPIHPQWVVRITSDCPLIDPALIDAIIDKAVAENADYCSNTLQPGFPDGTDVEVFKFSALEKAWNEATLRSDREHVTPFIYNNSDARQGTRFKAALFLSPEDYSHVRLTVDEASDFQVIERLVEQLGTEKDWKTYTDYYLQDPSIKQLNQHIGRNEGYTTSLNND